jgi:hypothetical protein
MTSLTFQQFIDSIHRVPETSDLHGRYSVYDAVVLVSGANRANVSKIWSSMVCETPEWTELPKYRFEIFSSRKTPAATVKELIQIVCATPGVAHFLSQHMGVLRRPSDVDLPNPPPYPSRVVLVDKITCPAQPAGTITLSAGVSNEYRGMAVVAQCGGIGMVNVKALPRAQESTLMRAVEGMLRDVHVPHHIATRPGAYCGIQGEMTENDTGVDYLRVKVGKYDKPVQMRLDEHGIAHPYWRTVWAGAVTTGKYLPKDIEDRLKVRFKRHLGGMVVHGHKMEEFLILKGPDAFSTIDEITRCVELDLGEHVAGTHAYAAGGHADDEVVPTEASTKSVLQIQLEIERSKAESERSKAERAKEETKQMELQFDMLKLRMSAPCDESKFGP